MQLLRDDDEPAALYLRIMDQIQQHLDGIKHDFMSTFTCSNFSSFDLAENGYTRLQ